jgi:hypothetical protein
MNTALQQKKSILSKHPKRWLQLFSVWMILSIAIPWQVFAGVPLVQAKPDAAPLALTSTITLSVISARDEPKFNGGAGVTKGTVITAYKFIINIDNTGTTEQRAPSPDCTPENSLYPGSCNWVSIAGAATSSPIYTQGSEADLGTTSGSIGILIAIAASNWAWSE